MGNDYVRWMFRMVPKIHRKMGILAEDATLFWNLKNRGSIRYNTYMGVRKEDRGQLSSKFRSFHVF